MWPMRTRAIRRTSMQLRLLAAVLVALLLAEPSNFAFAASDAPQPIAASDVDRTYFDQQLAQFGHWIYHPTWGEVWKPDAGPGFRPYFNGYWQFTSDYGWLWV